MGRLVWLPAAFLLLMAACQAYPDPKMSEGHPPVIEAIQASPTVNWLEIWKVFMRVSDPDGDIWQVRFYPRQRGIMYSTAQGYMTLATDMQAGFDGYFYLFSPSMARARGQLKVDWTVYVIDKTGRKSAEYKLPLLIGRRPAQPDPPGFANRRLLEIPYLIRYED